jgi:NAD(P)-dependent dehydrogenase (short-subunit alcohol dehydrogenase family)
MAEQQLLAGRVAAVTGAASGMGRVMARALAVAGAKVAGVDLDAAGLDRLSDALASEASGQRGHSISPRAKTRRKTRVNALLHSPEPGSSARDEAVFAGRFLEVVADVSKTGDCRGAVDKVIDAFGALDILVNCAGVSMSSAAGHKDARIKFFEADPDAWQRIITINSIGAFLMARFAAPAMIKRGWGRIINVTTSFDTMLAAGLSAYGASKAALEASCVSFAKDLEGTGVTVNILVPGGPTDTPGFFPPGKPRPQFLLDPEIMGAPVAWLASSQSDGISASRFIARDWDLSLPPSQAAQRARAPAAWPTLAQGASAARGQAM